MQSQHAGDIHSQSHEQPSRSSAGHAQTPHTDIHPHELEVARTPVHVADRPTSFFSSRRGAALCRCIPQCPPKNGQPRYHSYPLKSSTLRQADNYARTNAEAVLLTDQVRALEPGTPAYSDAKARLCSDLPGGVASPFRAKRHMIVRGM
jgi:hypothetical protein